MDESICPVCLISVDGIGCDGDCKRWFHIECVKMLKTEYSKFATVMIIRRNGFAIELTV